MATTTRSPASHTRPRPAPSAQKMRLAMGRVPLLLGVVGVLWAACANPEGQAREMYDLAQFEEQQRNFTHAQSLYAEILEAYPQTASAARARLAQLSETPQAPAPAAPLPAP